MPRSIPRTFISDYKQSFTRCFAMLYRTISCRMTASSPEREAKSKVRSEKQDQLRLTAKYLRPGSITASVDTVAHRQPKWQSYDVAPSATHRHIIEMMRILSLYVSQKPPLGCRLNILVGVELHPSHGVWATSMCHVKGPVTCRLVLHMHVLRIHSNTSCGLRDGLFPSRLE